MSKTIYVLSGPNLNLLGQREPTLYGHETLADVEAACLAVCTGAGLELFFRQTNIEHEMIQWLQDARLRAAGVVINPAGFSYHSVAVLDALRMFEGPCVEVHITNLHRREAEWRANSIMSSAVTGTITGLGVNGYQLAIQHVASVLKARSAKK
jgi:3-dehydroquinate dehydratase-2